MDLLTFILFIYEKTEKVPFKIGNLQILVHFWMFQVCVCLVISSFSSVLYVNDRQLVLRLQMPSQTKRNK